MSETSSDLILSQGSKFSSQLEVTVMKLSSVQ